MLRIGAVSYLNTKPLVYQLERLAPHVELSFDLPSRLADSLDCGELDVALIPSIEFFRQPDYTIVSDACIGCRGQVLSVKLLSRVPFANIKSVAMDEGSRTSVALTKILLHEKYGITPETHPFPIGTTPEELQTDAVLVIGDRAIHASDDVFVEHWDLGEEWCRWSDLPFVFAMWVAHRDADLNGLENILSQSRNLGVDNLEAIAEQECAAVGLSAEISHRYLRDNLYFNLGDREQRGLQLFYDRASALGLAPQGIKLFQEGPHRIGYAVS
jgi:chorismate dehydratase